MINTRGLTRTLAAWTLVFSALAMPAAAQRVERVADLQPGPSSSNPAELTAMNGILYFTYQNILWRSDGTEAGTTWVKNFFGPAGPPPGTTSEMVRIGDTLFLTAWTPYEGVELWKSDGTTAGTVFVKDVCPGECGAPKHLTNVDGILYFVEDAGLGFELYRSDGTADGTVLVKDIVPGPAGSDPDFLSSYEGQLFFSAFDGSVSTLWRTDGTSDGTLRVGTGSMPADPRHLTVAGPTLYFAADEWPGARTLWSTDGTSAGTRVVVPSAGPGSLNPENLVAVGDTLYFSADGGVEGVELWKTEGNIIRQVADIAFGSASSSPRDLIDVEGTLYFTADDGSNGRELWTADNAGPSGPTFLVADIATGPASSNPRSLIDVNGTLFFTADGPQGAEMWRSDGRPGGTQLVHDIEAGPSSSSPGQYTPVASAAGTDVFFTASTAANGTELYILRNLDPSADAGPDVSIELGETVTLDGAGSADPDGDPLTYQWQDPAGDTISESATVEVAPSFTAMYRLTVRDGFGGVATDTVTVEVAGTPTVELYLDVYGEDGGQGTVSVDPPGAICDNLGGSSSCVYPYAQGTPVTLVAAPVANSAFIGWMGACNGPGDCHVTMDDVQFVTAMFRGPQPLVLTVNGFSNGAGSVRLSPPNQLCSTPPGGYETCQVPYRPGTTVTLQALPATGSTFLGWSGSCSGSQPTCEVTVEHVTWVYATFQGPQPLWVIVDSLEGGSGSVQITPPDQSCTNAPGTQQFCENFYPSGTTVTLHAVAAPDSVFVGWFGPCFGPQPTCEVTVGSASMAFAQFRGPQILAVTVDSLEGGSGSVQISPPNTQCVNTPGFPQTCANPYRIGTTVLLDAFAAPDSVFIGWTSGACSGPNPTCMVTVDEAKFVTALFRGPQVLSVTVDSLEGGWGSVQISPPNTQCVNAPGSPQTCSNQYRIGTTVLLDAFAAPDSVFIGWTSGACSGPTPTCQVTVDEAKFVTALFRGPQVLSVTVDSLEGGWGSVQISPPNTQCVNAPGSPQTCSNPYRIGTTVLLDAFAAPDSVFIGWTSGACAGPIPTCQVTVDEAKFVTALFRGPQLLAVTVDSLEGGWGSVQISPPNTQCVNAPGSPQTCAHQYRIGTTVLLDAFAAPDSVFIGWTSGACAGPIPTCQVTVDEAKFVTALFRGPQVLSVTLESVEGGWGSVQMSPPNTQCVNTPGSPQTCAHQYRIGTTVLLDAFAGPDSVFVGWTSGACSGPIPTCQVTVDEAKFVVATFRGNHPPVAVPGGPYSALRNAAIAFDGTGSSDSDGDPLTYAWDFGDGATGIGANPTHAYAATGSYTVTLIVHDGRVASAPATTTVSIANSVPVAVIAGGPQSGVRGQALAFDGSGSSDGDGDSLTYSWSFGDGNTGSGPSASHAYATLGTFTVTLVVSDGVDSSAPASTTVTIANRAPVASVGGPYSGTHGLAIAFNASASTDADGDPLTFAWTFGDGGTGTGAAPSHIYATDGSYTVTVVASDGVDTATASTTVSVANLVPIAHAGGPYTVFRNTPLVLNGTASSDGNGDALTYSWNFGDGGTGTGPTPSHSWAAFGTFVVTLTVHDGHASSSPAVTQVTVPNRPPVANAGGPYSGVRGAAIAFSGAGSFDPDGNSLTYEWSFGDGTTGTGVNPTHVYTTVGSFVARLVVRDGGPQPSAESTAVVTIANRPPVARHGGPYTGKRNLAVQLNGSTSSDPDGDPLTYAWNFGDGTTGTGATPTHVYTTLGTFTISLTVHDGFTSSPAVTTTVTITNAPPVANAGPDRTVVRRTTVTLDGRASFDPDGTIAAWSWRQLSGPTVNLINRTTSQPRFTAPNVNQTTHLQFEVKVTDNNGATAIDTVRITVIR